MWTGPNGCGEPGHKEETWYERCNDYKMLPDGWGEKVHLVKLDFSVWHRVRWSWLFWICLLDVRGNLFYSWFSSYYLNEWQIVHNGSTGLQLPPLFCSFVLCYFLLFHLIPFSFFSYLFHLCSHPASQLTRFKSSLQFDGSSFFRPWGSQFNGF